MIRSDKTGKLSRTSAARLLMGAMVYYFQLLGFSRSVTDKAV